jgi:hypothetical protein
MLRIYTAACQYVQQFLHPGETLDSERPPYRRRLDVPALSPQSSTGTSTSSVSPEPSDHGIGSRSSPSSISMVSVPSARSLGASTAETTPSPPSPPAKPQDSPQASAADPFGYLDDGPTQNPQPAPSTSRLAQSIPGLMFASPGFLGSPHNMLTYATPIHSHAYITFGAGMRQKEIDQFSAANPLGAHSLAGGRSAVPYHIPL